MLSKQTKNSLARSASAAAIVTVVMAIPSPWMGATAWLMLPDYAFLGPLLAFVICFNSVRFILQLPSLGVSFITLLGTVVGYAFITTFWIQANSKMEFLEKIEVAGMLSMTGAFIFLFQLFIALWLMTWADQKISTSQHASSP